MESAKSIILG